MNIMATLLWGGVVSLVSNGLLKKNTVEVDLLKMEFISIIWFGVSTCYRE